MIKSCVEDYMETASYYISQLVEGIWLKSFLSAIFVIFVDRMHGDVLALEFYLIAASIDLTLGMLNAHIRNTFEFKYVLYWVRKLVTYMLLFSLCGGIGYTLYMTTGALVSLVNWMILICIITEVSSICHNLRRLGCPLPPAFEYMITLLRKKASKQIIRAAGGDEKDEAELEDALGKPKRRSRKGE